MSDDPISDDGVFPGVFMVLDIGEMIDTEGERWPTAVIDPEGHPEIADLARVHAVEGIGDIATDATLVPIDSEHATHLLVLAIRITVPVRCAFGVAFALPAQRQVLDAAVEAGRMVIATTSPDEAETEQPLWLAIDLDPESLARSLPD